MRFSRFFIPTLRESSKETESAGQNLLIRGGFMRKTAPGLHTFLPLGFKVINHIEEIIREEMETYEAAEMSVPILIPSETLNKSGRYTKFGSELFKTKDRHNRDYCLCPSHEEAFSQVIRSEVRSHKQLPLLLYQIQTKFTDEKSNKHGIYSSREFFMKDAYSFDKDEEGFSASFHKMYNAYCRIFDKIGLNYFTLNSSLKFKNTPTEFVVKSDLGETVIAKCNSCDYAADALTAVCMTKNISKDYTSNKKSFENNSDLTKEVFTPNIKTINQLCEFFNTTPDKFIKTLIFKANDKHIAVLVRGDRELNCSKLEKLLNCTNLEMADEESVKKITGADIGFAGPVGLSEADEIIVDYEVINLEEAIVGANKTNFHLTGVNPKKDFSYSRIADIRKIMSGDKCPYCDGTISLQTVSKIGYLSKIDPKFSSDFNCKFLNKNGCEEPILIGTYRIFINRIMALLAEKYFDERGLIWPIRLAPFKVLIIPVNTGNEEQMMFCKKIHKIMSENKIDTIIDDREINLGIKFKDADLIGIPIRITVGKKLKDNLVEIKMRKSNESFDVSTSNILNYITELVNCQ